MPRQSISANGVEVRTVRLSQVAFNDTYQRTINKSRSRKIKDTFNWRYFGLPTLVPTGNGRYEAADGQHRLYSLHLLFPDGVDSRGREIKFLALVVTQEAAYKIFVGANSNQRSVTPNQVFKANYVGGERIERFIVNTLNGAGIEVRLDGKGRPGVGVTKATSAFRELYEVVGRDGFRQVVGILQNSFSRPDGEDVEAEALSPDFVKGLAKFFSSTAYTVGFVAEALSRSEISAAAIVQRARRKESRWGQIEAIKQGLAAAVEDAVPRRRRRAA